MEYKFNEIEKKWQDKWKADKVYKVSNESDKPKYYVLDMFPYPSGAGLHVGHPLGYIASDIYARYKRLKGYNVLHPMGFDSFGLPAEQYAIETGQHPAETTKKNIATFKSQLDKIGFCYDWDREVQTSDPNYYKWTQWIFLKLYNSYFDKKSNKAKPIAELIKQFETEGASFTTHHSPFTADEWKGFDEKAKQDVLMNYRLAFSKFGEVNWCEALGTVLANDEVVNGVSERGGHPVVKKKMRQWYLRITAYADRLLEGLETVDFSDSMKEMQRNWIGRSEGAEVVFPLSISPRRGEDMEEIRAKKEAKPGQGYAKYSVDSPMNFENAKQMRKEPTEAEKVLWEALRNRSIGYKFRRQHPVENFIADFICLDVWLVVEVDGAYHSTEQQRETDKLRDARLNEIGFTTLRFTNEQVLHDLDNTLKSIKEKADVLKRSTTPPKKEKNEDETENDEQEKNVGCSSPLQGEAGVRVYTTRPDTIFGVDFMVLAPEHELVNKIKSADQAAAVDEYVAYVKSRSDVDRMAEKKITGCFTGAHAINPFDGKQIPIWISEYVLAGYGTGAIMAVPCGDERDFKFAKHFNIPITNIIGSHFNGEEANPTKEAVLENSGFLNGMVMKDAIAVAVKAIEEKGIGIKKVNYKMRDAGFSRQRYWGEPFPIIWEDGGVPFALSENDLPLELPHVDKYGPGPEGEGPLANIKDWINTPMGRRESSTMPGYAGSSWYFLRYMDPHNNETFCDRKASDYWNQVDLYIGGTEHAVGHLLYSRLWTKVLFDLGLIGYDEPFKRLVNQGMITGRSYYLDIVRTSEEQITSENYQTILKEVQYLSSGEYTKKYGVDVKLNEADDYLAIVPGAEKTFGEIRIKYGHQFVDSKDRLTESALKKYINKYPEFDLQIENFIWNQSLTEDGERFVQCKGVVEKMSKSKFNVENPDDLCHQYGADTFRMYEMFLGPVEQSKPWDTKGIEGVHRFLRKLWRLFNDELKGKVWTDAKATDAELKVLHKTIKKIEEDTERFSFNTAVSTFMICVNELADLKCYKKEVLEQLLILLTPYAPHIAEELWSQLGNSGSILDATYPVFNPALLVESTKEYPVSINGKVRTNINLALDLEQAEVEQLILQNEVVQKWLEGKAPKKIIYVKNKMVNVVI